jgi:CPA1 family monovalent cation:H+ antiporter
MTDIDPALDPGLIGRLLRPERDLMSLFQLSALFLTLVAAVGWVNSRWLGLPRGVAMLAAGLIGAVSLYGLERLVPQWDALANAVAAISKIDFAQTVVGYMLGFLLFAGAMQVDLHELRRRKLAVWTLATLGVFASTALVGGGVWLGALALRLDLPLSWALVFGALISPTDPVAVLATVRHGGLSKGLKAILQGEALFNDGVGIVVFLALLALAANGSAAPAQAALQVVVKAGGGLLFGLACGFVVLRAMRMVDDYAVEVALSLALAVGVYAAADALRLSGPIAVVAAGLMIGDLKVNAAASETSQRYLRAFWTLVDEILNALLFLLLGLELLVVPLDLRSAGLWLVAIPLVLLARLATVFPWGTYFHLRQAERGPSLILAWGGLHGALSLALALSIPQGPHRPLILSLTYAVVVFSVAVQGLTFGPLVDALGRSRPARASRSSAAEA